MKKKCQKARISLLHAAVMSRSLQSARIASCQLNLSVSVLRRSLADSRYASSSSSKFLVIGRSSDVLIVMSLRGEDSEEVVTGTGLPHYGTPSVAEGMSTNFSSSEEESVTDGLAFKAVFIPLYCTVFCLCFAGRSVCQGAYRAKELTVRFISVALYTPLTFCILCHVSKSTSVIFTEPTLLINSSLTLAKIVYIK